MEQSGNTIGVVENIVGIATYDITIHGEQNHAGTTVMSLRKDPVVAAARLISSLTDEISARSPSATVTFGRVDTDPGCRMLLLAEPISLLDMREKDEEMLREHEALLMELVQKIQSNGMQAGSCQNPVDASGRDGSEIGAACPRSSGGRGLSLHPHEQRSRT